jgi:hypothetical protein
MKRLLVPYESTYLEDWTTQFYLGLIRQFQDTEKIRSILRTSILRLFLGPLVIWPKVGENTELLHILKEWRSLRFSSCLASTYLRIYTPMYVGHTYLLNSEEGLTEQALSSGKIVWFILPNKYSRMEPKASLFTIRKLYDLRKSVVKWRLFSLYLLLIYRTNL